MRKAIIGLAICVMAISGCATIGTLQDENATAAEKKAALCKDATDGYNLAETMLKDPVVINQPEASAYWNTYKVGVNLVISANCSAAK